MEMVLLLLFPLFVALLVLPHSLAQTIANVPDLDSQIPNFYRWMEQNAYICEPQSADGPIFLGELEADQFNCQALCGDPVDNPHLACAKRPSQPAHQFPHCETIPPLCVLNFVQEFLALRIARGEMSMEHLETQLREQQHTVAVDSVPPVQTEQKEEKGGNDRVVAAVTLPAVDSSFEQTKGRVDDRRRREDFLLVDKETGPGGVGERTNANGGSKSTETRRTSKEEQGREERRASLLERVLLPSQPRQLPFAGLSKSKDCLPDREPGACHFWADIGECHRNPDYMHRECRRACGICRSAAEGEFRQS